MRHVSDPDIAAGAGPIFDDDVAAKRGAEILREDSRHDVGRAGGRKRHDDPDWPLGIGGGDSPPDAERRCRRRAGRKAGGPQDRRREGRALLSGGIVLSRAFLGFFSISAQSAVLFEPFDHLSVPLPRKGGESKPTARPQRSYPAKFQTAVIASDLAALLFPPPCGGGSPPERAAPDSNFKQPGQAVIASASEAIHGRKEEAWIASSRSLPCANASRLSQAMTSSHAFAFSPRVRASFADILPPSRIRGRRECRAPARPQPRVQCRKHTR